MERYLEGCFVELLAFQVAHLLLVDLDDVRPWLEKTWGIPPFRHLTSNYICVYCNICKNIYIYIIYIHLFTIVHTFMYVSVQQFHLPDWMVTNYNHNPLYIKWHVFHVASLSRNLQIPPIGHSSNFQGFHGETPHPRSDWLWCPICGLRILTFAWSSKMMPDLKAMEEKTWWNRIRWWITSRWRLQLWVDWAEVPKGSEIMKTKMMLEKNHGKTVDILFSDHPPLPRWKMQGRWFQREKPTHLFFLQPFQDHRRWAAFWLSWMHWRFHGGLERWCFGLLSRDLFLVGFFKEVIWESRKLPKSPTIACIITVPKLEITCIISYFPFRIRDTTEDMQQNPKCSMHGIFTYMYHKFKPNVGRYSIHGEFGNVMLQNVLGVVFSTSRLPSFSGIWSICTLDDSVIFQHRMLARGEGRRRGTEAFCKVFQEWGAECVLDGYEMCFVACLSRYV